MVEAAKQTSRADTGSRQVLAASKRNALCNSPCAGGAASKGPMIEKRSRAQRSRLGASVIVFKRSPVCAPPAAALMGVNFTNPGRCWLFASSAGDQQPSRSVIGRPTVKGARKTRSRINDSSANPVKRSIRLAGNCAVSTGGMKRAQAACHSGVTGKCSSHQVRQRASVRYGTSRV